MAGEEVNSDDFYAVLGCDKECSDLQLKSAYRKLAMRWHPDKCTASGSVNTTEESKEKFQEIQQAYSVLSDSNKRLLYDVGVYDKNDDADENGMGDFLGEVAQMINESKPTENGPESFEELQRLFVELFQDDINAGFANGSVNFRGARPTEFCGVQSTGSPEMLPRSSSAPVSENGSNKRGTSAMENTSKVNSGDYFDLPTTATGNFCFGVIARGVPDQGTIHWGSYLCTYSVTCLITI